MNAQIEGRRMNTPFTKCRKAFLVPDSCRATGRNCNSISADVTDDAIEND
jgi:hypothetical protein